MSTYQSRVQTWILDCFGPEIARNLTERNYRFLEEALELVQALGCERDAAHRLVDYVFNREAGRPGQEVGGVLVTLAALCSASAIDMDAAGEIELRRVRHPETMAKIRAKHNAKEIRTAQQAGTDPLPGDWP
jgi:hypothetical protein